MLKTAYFLFCFLSISTAAFADGRIKLTTEQKLQIQKHREMREKIPEGNIPGRRFGVSQKMLSSYRSSHPNFNFPEKLKNLIEPQAHQIHQYFYENYRIGEIKDEVMRAMIFKLCTQMEIEQIEKIVNQSISEFYEVGKFSENEKGYNRPAFDAPFGSVAMISYLNVKDENVQPFLDILVKNIP